MDIWSKYFCDLERFEYGFGFFLLDRAYGMGPGQRFNTSIILTFRWKCKLKIGSDPDPGIFFDGRLRMIFFESRPGSCLNPSGSLTLLRTPQATKNHT